MVWYIRLPIWGWRKVSADAFPMNVSHFWAFCASRPHGKPIFRPDGHFVWYIQQSWAMVWSIGLPIGGGGKWWRMRLQWMFHTFEQFVLLVYTGSSFSGKMAILCNTFIKVKSRRLFRVIRSSNLSLEGHFVRNTPEGCGGSNPFEMNLESHLMWYIR